MNEEIYKTMNNSHALELYKESLNSLRKYFEGEINPIIIQNTIVVADGLEKIIKLKSEEEKNE